MELPKHARTARTRMGKVSVIAREIALHRPGRFDRVCARSMPAEFLNHFGRQARFFEGCYLFVAIQADMLRSRGPTTFKPLFLDLLPPQLKIRQG